MWIQRPGDGTRRPPLKKEVEEAQRNSLSAAGAARMMGISYATYKKYARLYGIHDQHVNQGGKGIPKLHFQGKRFALSDILEGKHPTYNVKRLQQQLIKGGYMDEQCMLCSFQERRIVDFTGCSPRVIEAYGRAHESSQKCRLIFLWAEIVPRISSRKCLSSSKLSLVQPVQELKIL